MKMIVGQVDIDSLTFLIFRCISYSLIYTEPSVEYKENKGTKCGVRVLIVKFAECN